MVSCLIISGWINVIFNLFQASFWFFFKSRCTLSLNILIHYACRNLSCCLNGTQVPQARDIKYLGMHLNRKLNWKKYICIKRKHLELKLIKIYWLLGRNSQLSLKNKILLYKTTLKSIWTYGIQFWSIAANSNLEIL
jgi:hypothetical protein